MHDVATLLISKALDGLNQRYLYTAQNIANANSPDYRPLRVSFEDSLRVAAAAGTDTLIAHSPQVHQESADAGAMRLDLELAEASRTAARYRALIDILGRQLGLHQAVVAAAGR